MDGGGDGDYGDYDGDEDDDDGDGGDDDDDDDGDIRRTLKSLEVEVDSGLAIVSWSTTAQQKAAYL